MDVHCSSCGEPWDTHHLLYDAVHETALGEAEITTWLALPPARRFDPHYREQFAAAGWQFGTSVLHVRRCPCCPKGATPDPEHDIAKAAVCELLGDDEDGIAANLEDFGL